MRSTAPDLVLERVPFTDARVATLVEEVQAYYVQIYGGPDESPFDAAQFAPPAGLFVLGTVDGEPVAMGGWRRRPDLTDTFHAEVAEVKRMFVSPRVRRRGYAARLLSELERTARDAGAEFLVLETGSEQPDAIALYKRAGYASTLRFGHYAIHDSSRYYGRSLTSSPLPTAPEDPAVGRQDP
jgi:GNAT superfamily N-acetyltransferase